MIRRGGCSCSRALYSGVTKKLIILMTSTIGSALGWWIGAPVGIMTAFILSFVGLGVGIWAGDRLFKRIGL